MRNHKRAFPKSAKIKKGLMRTTQAVSFKRDRLDKIMFQVSQRLPRHYLMDVNYREYEDHMDGALVRQIEFALYGKRSMEEETTVEDYIKYPATWVDACKERFLPGWLKGWYPVKYTGRLALKKVTRNITKVCPHINIQSDKPHIEFVTVDGQLRTY